MGHARCFFCATVNLAFSVWTKEALLPFFFKKRHVGMWAEGGVMLKHDDSTFAEIGYVVGWSMDATRLCFMDRGQGAGGRHIY
jgi:hypothetical protein